MVVFQSFAGPFALGDGGFEIGEHIRREQRLQGVAFAPGERLDNHLEGRGRPLDKGAGIEAAIRRLDLAGAFRNR